MPRKTHPNRRNTRRTPANTQTVTVNPTSDSLAQRLVERGLASPLILEGRRYPMHYLRDGGPHAS